MFEFGIGLIEALRLTAGISKNTTIKPFDIYPKFKSDLKSNRGDVNVSQTTLNDGIDSQH
ncbi:hypothetical protein [Methanobrevibacter sp.]|uniref:hypothetical protein n=1 Tax=Methanobrevibacter sp. TaxID=66852 RepID=UPI00388D5894